MHKKYRPKVLVKVQAKKAPKVRGNLRGRADARDPGERFASVAAQGGEPAVDAVACIRRIRCGFGGKVSTDDGKNLLPVQLMKP